MDGRSFAGAHHFSPDIRYNMTIEFLSLHNLSESLDFAEKSHLDSAWADYSFDRDELCKNLEQMIGKDQYFTCIYRKEGEIIGYFFASLGKFLFSKRLIGMENGIYIDQKHRGGRVAYLMYNEYLKWCGRLDVEPLVEIYFGSDDNNEKVYEFFLRSGMIECGRVFRGGSNGLRSRYCQ